MRAVFHLLLILSLTVASVLMAPSRGHMAWASQIEICSDAGTETITLDARGDPVDGPSVCVDCLACCGVASLPDTAGLRAMALSLSLSYPARRGGQAAAARQRSPAARDPPVVV